MSKNLLITGASGFVGHHLIEEAVKQGYTVFASVRQTSKIDHLKAFPIQFTSLDFEDHNALRKNLEQHQYDYIIHAAGALKASGPQEYDFINAEYSHNLAQAAVSAGIPLKKFVFISSLAAVGPTATHQETITENTTPNPVTHYGKSKLLAESMLRSFKTLPLVTLRPTAVYGPYERDIFIMLQALNRGFELYIGRVPQQLSFVYVKDVVSATMLALQATATHKSYNLSDGHKYDRYQLASTVKNILHKKTITLHLPVTGVRLLAGVLETVYGLQKKTPALNYNKLAELTASNWHCSIESAKADLGFDPQYDLQQGMHETLDWYKANRWL
jgi:UDP-glucose 4-epimerase